MSAIIKESTQLGRCKDRSFARNDGVIEANLAGKSLDSHFQPIFSLSHRRPIGYEGVLRVIDENNHSIEPMDAFNSLQNEEDVVELDRLSRFLHVSNYKRQINDRSWLFLNIHPVTLNQVHKYGRFLGELLSEFDIEPQNVVVEIHEDAVDDNGLLRETVEYYRELGCLIAIDDFGTGQSNFDRLWLIEPDIVKLDKTIIRDLKEKKVIERMLPNLVSLIHECGSLVLLEGVENEAQALVAVDSGVDFIQGFYLARPDRKLLTDVTSESLGDSGLDLSTLCSAYQTRVNHDLRSRKKIINTYIETFSKAANEIKETGEFEKAINRILTLSGVERCYILNRRGQQVGANFFPEDHDELFPQRFSVLEDRAKATWYRRKYFRRAINEPDQVHTSRPYLSMTAGIVCITFSILIKSSTGEEMVLCCDIDWSDR